MDASNSRLEIVRRYYKPTYCYEAAKEEYPDLAKLVKRMDERSEPKEKINRIVDVPPLVRDNTWLKKTVYKVLTLNIFYFLILILYKSIIT